MNRDSRTYRTIIKELTFVSPVSQKEKEKKEGEAGKVFEETMAEKSPNLAKDTNLQIQEVEQNPTG